MYNHNESMYLSMLSMYLRSQLYLKCNSIIAKHMGECVCSCVYVYTCMYLLH